MIQYLLNKVENYQPVLSVDNFFTEEELEKISIQLCDVNVKPAIAGWKSNINSEEDMNAAISHSLIARKSNIYWLDDPMHEWIYNKVEIAINHVNLTNYNKLLYGIESLQYAEYDSKYNGFYKAHIDHYIEHTPLKRSLSFTIQLSREEDYEGGELLIYVHGKTIKANKTYGTITFFDSMLLHEVTPVTSGFRKSLVGWIVGPRV
jgi:PKHD-type hydroxylase